MSEFFGHGDEHLKPNISAETIAKLRKLIDDANLITGAGSFSDCGDGRAARQSTVGEAFDAASDKTSSRDYRHFRRHGPHYDYGSFGGYDYYAGYSRGAHAAEDFYRMHEPYHSFGDTAINGSLAWKYPDAIDVQSWEVEVTPPSPELEA